MNFATLRRALPDAQELLALSAGGVAVGVEWDAIGLMRRGTRACLCMALCDDGAQSGPLPCGGRNLHPVCALRAVTLAGRRWDVDEVELGGMGDLELIDTVGLIDFLRAGYRPAEDWMDRDFSHMSLAVAQLREPMSALPPAHGPVTLHLDDGWRSFSVKRRILLPVEGEPGSRLRRVTDRRTGARCAFYLGRVTLHDPWERAEKIPADAERSLEQMCPRGMCLPIVEYEAAAGISLQLDDAQSLKARARSGAMSVLARCSGVGPHGLPLRAAALPTAVPQDARAVEIAQLRVSLAVPGADVELTPRILTQEENA